MLIRLYKTLVQLCLLIFILVLSGHIDNDSINVLAQDTKSAQEVQGERGPRGPQGIPGPAGADGKNGLNCWDLDHDEICDYDEDIDRNVICNAMDCKGSRRLIPQSSVPKNPVLGDMYYHDSEAICVFMATGWVRIAGIGLCNENFAEVGTPVNSKTGAIKPTSNKSVFSKLTAKKPIAPPPAIKQTESRPVTSEPSANKPTTARQDSLKQPSSRFIDNQDGTVSDTATGLMWASSSNTESINWLDAKTYYDSYNGGGYTDWRVPTNAELQGLFKAGVRGKNRHDLIKIDGTYVWSSEANGSQHAFFNFLIGHQGWNHQKISRFERALPVRSYK